MQSPRGPNNHPSLHYQFLLKEALEAMPDSLEFIWVKIILEIHCGGITPEL